MLENAVGRATRIRIGAPLEQSALEGVEAVLIQPLRHILLHDGEGLFIVQAGAIRPLFGERSAESRPGVACGIERRRFRLKTSPPARSLKIR